jgi:hypothetical protein
MYVAASDHVGMQHSVAVDVVLRLQLAVCPGYSTGDVDAPTQAGHARAIHIAGDMDISSCLRDGSCTKAAAHGEREGCREGAVCCQQIALMHVAGHDLQQQLAQHVLYNSVFYAREEEATLLFISLIIARVN